ncbi:unknown protein [Seminavis robusta]|uniref:Tyr recombinase domain-containing protein n=1 Tax=Seminavis robusta TaxID=568900 RepID=A0A9N8HTS8_9STRA|nr:unknown protein [Seminavis robusta]|eukprot:Sro1935_g306370.1 n/a (275) ;mRNA; f:12074-13087
MYAVHLSSGHSIQCKSIKASTIDQYLLAASSLIRCFTQQDYRKDKLGDRTMGAYLSGVMRDIRRYETMADRREPYDHRMHALACKVAAKFPIISLVCCLTDGFEQGLCTGYRLTEWAQPAGKTNVLSPHGNGRTGPECKTRAVIPNDIRAVGLCGVMHPGLSPASTPLSVYWNPKSRHAKLVDGSAIEKFMRRLAAAVYNLHPLHDKADLSKWSSHSLRVGARVILHIMGFSDRDIQWILRWKSMSFVMYFRNVAILSRRQNAAFDRLQALPRL